MWLCLYECYSLEHHSTAHTHTQRNHHTASSTPSPTTQHHQDLTSSPRAPGRGNTTPPAQQTHTYTATARRSTLTNRQHYVCCSQRVRNLRLLLRRLKSCHMWPAKSSLSLSLSLTPTRGLQREEKKSRNRRWWRLMEVFPTYLPVTSHFLHSYSFPIL